MPPPQISLIITSYNQQEYLREAIFFFIDTATTEIYTTYDTLSLHVALPIFSHASRARSRAGRASQPQSPRVRPTATRDRKSTRLNSSHRRLSRMPSSA